MRGKSFELGGSLKREEGKNFLPRIFKPGNIFSAEFKQKSKNSPKNLNPAAPTERRGKTWRKS
jgi:hypothetical protein